jgi:4-hydroxy-tetrahydrodipicolinate reductase
MSPREGRFSEKIRAVVFGVGAMGSVATRLMREQGIEIVGALARSPEKIGRDLGEVTGLGVKLGVPIEDDAERLLTSRRPDIVVAATGNYMDEMYGQMRACAEVGVNAVSIASELELANPGVPSEMTTVTSLVNRIPDVINARPGFLTIDKLPRPRYRPHPPETYLLDRT